MSREDWSASPWCEQIGVKALIEAAGMDERKIDSTALAFGVAPRINAAGQARTAPILPMELLTQ